MKRLGAALIVKNESENIRECLESIKELDEIVVIDTGSTDDTVSICREYTSKVYTDYKWEDDFSKARNISLSRCTADYLIIIDADERLISPVSKIKKIINEHWFRKYIGMYFVVQMKYEVFEAPRLLKNDKEIYYINAAHNVPVYRGQAGDLTKRLYKSSFNIYSGYSNAHNLDPDRTLRILQKSHEKKPDDTRTLYYLAREYLNRKDVKKAIELFEKYKELKFNCVDLWDNELADVLYLMALCYVDPEAWNELRWFDAVECALWSHCVLPTSKDTTEFLKRCFIEMPGSVEGAIRSQQQTVKFWDEANKNATDAGVLMKRIFDN